MIHVETAKPIRSMISQLHRGVIINHEFDGGQADDQVTEKVVLSALRVVEYVAHTIDLGFSEQLDVEAMLADLDLDDRENIELAEKHSMPAVAAAITSLYAYQRDEEET
jgi:hypothetical protein